MSDSELFKQCSISNYNRLSTQGGEHSASNAVLKCFRINHLEILLFCKADDRSSQGMLRTAFSARHRFDKCAF